MDIRYFNLSLAIAFGVLLGNLGTGFVQWSIAAYIAKGAVQEMSEVVSSQQLKQSRIQSDIQVQKLTRQQREESSKGKALRANCNQWRAQSERMNTKYVQQEMRNRCAVFKRYLNTGK